MTTKQKPQKRNKPDHVSVSKLRHFRLAAHRHTGKLLPHRHTSHVALVGILVVVGFFVYVSQDIARADQTVNHNVVVSGIIPGPPPTNGATITSPQNGAIFTDQTIIAIDGTCEADTFVVVASNDSTVGSTMCTSAGIFTLSVQLSLGQNVLSAKNYDSLNQTGPDTPTVTITLNVTSSATPQQPSSGTSTPTPQPPAPALPANPSYIPAMGDAPAACNEHTAALPLGGMPKVAVVCVPRLFQANTEYTLGIMIWGGAPPYALDINWGDGGKTPNTLVSLATAGYKSVTFKYAQSGHYVITIKLKDKDGNDAFVQTATSVTGESQSLLGAIKNSISHISWFEAPVPLYLLAVALTLGFWGGDIFDRRFGVTKQYRKTRKSV